MAGWCVLEPFPGRGKTGEIHSRGHPGPSPVPVSAPWCCIAGSHDTASASCPHGMPGACQGLVSRGFRSRGLSCIGAVRWMRPGKEDKMLHVKLHASQAKEHCRAVNKIRTAKNFNNTMMELAKTYTYIHTCPYEMTFFWQKAPTWCQRCCTTSGLPALVPWRRAGRPRWWARPALPQLPPPHPTPGVSPPCCILGSPMLCQCCGRINAASLLV